jgi:hypothetical protein
MSDLYRLPDGRTTLKAHDVRHLCTCKVCGGMADNRETVFETHPKCYYEEHGRRAVLSLDVEDRNKFSLSDIPVALMKELIG